MHSNRSLKEDHLYSGCERLSKIGDLAVLSGETLNIGALDKLTFKNREAAVVALW